MAVPTPDGSLDPFDLEAAADIEVWAAGGVIWRAGAAGVEVLVIHRPARQDWSLPKGKVDHGETLIETAMREIREETGFECELSEPVGAVRYQDARARSKAVVYFEGVVADGAFMPNDEVDEIRWCPPPEAASLLTYPQDAKMLVDFARARLEPR